MLVTTKLETKFPIAAPLIPPIKLFKGIRTLFNIIPIIASIMTVIIGILLSPIPINTPLIVCSIDKNIIVNALICNNVAPLDAFGNSNPNISCEKNK